MTRPDPQTPPPHAVGRLAGTRDITAVWRNELGGITFRLTAPTDVLYAKWQPAGSQIDLAVEATKLSWAFTYVAVPEVVEHGSDSTGQWLVTHALPGTNAVDDRWTAQPSVAAHALGAGLRMFHDAIPVDHCPFDWSVDSRIGAARRRGHTVDVGGPPGQEDLVVCHGDACAPNTLLDDRGNVTAHVDLGQLGLADRWADLAPAIMSTAWNYGRPYTDEVLTGYGTELDRNKLDFYSRLWNET